MTEGDILSREDRIRQAYNTLRELGAVSRGDSFDIGHGESGESTDVTSYLTNPLQTLGINLSPSQKRNVRSLIVGGGTGTIHRFLSDYLGDEIAGAIGGLISGWLARKVVRRD